MLEVSLVAAAIFALGFAAALDTVLEFQRGIVSITLSSARPEIGHTNLPLYKYQPDELSSELHFPLSRCGTSGSIIPARSAWTHPPDA